MKTAKLTAVLLAVCLLLTSLAGMMTVSAAENAQEKLDQSLVEAMERSADGDVLSITITLDFAVDRAAIVKTVNESYTWSDQNEYQHCYREELKKVIGGKTQAFVDENSSLIEEVIWQGKFARIVTVKAAKSNIPVLAAQDIVKEIHLFSDVANVELSNDGAFYESDFIEWAAAKFGEEALDPTYARPPYRYEELYYHTDKGKIDWVLVSAYLYNIDVADAESKYLVGGMYLFNGVTGMKPFGCAYGVYDVKRGEFFGIEELTERYDEYDDLMDVLNELKIGVYVGDVNLDGKVNVVDATMIQRKLAGLEVFTYEQSVIADVNNDNGVNIDDATAVQNISAGITDNLE